MYLNCSIVIPTKNRPALLRRAVRSALLAAGPLDEVIVVDDDSAVPAGQVLENLSHQELRIISVPAGQRGVSAARNAGIAAAQRDVVFFLDDDDELFEDYCSRVMKRAAQDYDYGFSSYVKMNEGATTPQPGSRRFAEGPIASNAPLNKQLCGFGMGFWIRRDIALETGDVDTNLTINEDTEYLCRLIKAGRRGWYSAKAGVILHSHTGSAENVGHLTHRSSAAERARCMLAVCDRYPDFAHHLGPSYVRHCLKTKAVDDAWAYIKSQPDWRLRTQLRLFAMYKSLAYRLVQHKQVS